MEASALLLFHNVVRIINVPLSTYRGFMRETTSTPEEISSQVQSLEKEVADMKRQEADLDRLVL